MLILETDLRRETKDAPVIFRESSDELLLLLLLFAPNFMPGIYYCISEFLKQTMFLRNITKQLFWTYNVRYKYTVGSKSFRPDIQKPRQMENAVRDI